jgi:histidinol-phosphatase (PHP family)
MYFDTHVHSRVSPDSEMDPAAAIRTMQKQGMGVIFTEHVDYVTPRIGRDDTATDAPHATDDFLTDLTEYPKTYLPFKNPTVGLGLEIGLCAAYMPLNKQTASIGGLDFILGSIHFVDGWDIYTEFCRQCPLDPYRRMLTYTAEMIVLNDFFDSLGHIDYISRYSPLAEQNVLYEKYPDEYDAVFTALIERGKALEINTARFGNARAETNLFRLYKRYNELGGTIVTLGSDAHHISRLCRYFDRALGMVREAGLTVVYFRDRKP